MALYVCAGVIQAVVGFITAARATMQGWPDQSAAVSAAAAAALPILLGVIP
jgi:hypothetical protein